jgi:Transposase domain (DUF772)
LRALLLQAFYSVRSERLLMEQLDYNLLFRWFVGLGIDDPVWHPTAFTTNRDRLLQGEVAARVLAVVLDHAQVRQLLSREHFSVDGTLIEAWASLKSFRPKDGADEAPGGGRNSSRDFHGEQRRNDTHASSTDAEARLFRKGVGKEARLCFMGHLLMENRSGLVVATRLTQATGLAERAAAGGLIEDVPAGTGSRSGLIAPMIPRTSSSPCAGSTPRRTWRSTSPAGVRASTAAPYAIPATWRANGRASGSRRRSPGSKPSPARPRPASAALAESAGLSPWLRPRTT